MYGLSIGVSNIGNSLPRPVYALLSGLNSATVGIIALAAVQLSKKAITDKVTRILVFFGAAAGLLYNALWYFPLLMLVASIVAIVHDYRWLHRPIMGIVGFVRHPMRRQRRESAAGDHIELPIAQQVDDQVGAGNQAELAASTEEHRRRPGSTRSTTSANGNDLTSPVPVHGSPPPASNQDGEEDLRVIPVDYQLAISWKAGLVIILGFFASFVVVMVLRGVLPEKPLLYSLFANMYLAGTIIFGGGPVVIPLLREYVVAEGWVSPRDFLLGLALIQSFPGPNFNFAVYLGGLTAINGGYNSAAGAVLGYLGIFLPGLVTVHGTIGIWSAIRGLRWVKSALRGVNAAAVGLIYTAVYRLWQIGFIDEGFQAGTSLAVEPWWVVVTATSYVGGCWFGMSPPVAIVMGAVMGLIWYGVVSH
jgi:chromate transport protein ChrA